MALAPCCMVPGREEEQRPDALRSDDVGEPHQADQRSPMALTKWLCEERTVSRYTPLALLHRPERRWIVSSRPNTGHHPGSRWCSSSFRSHRLVARADQQARFSTWWYKAKSGSACHPAPADRRTRCAGPGLARSRSATAGMRTSNSDAKGAGNGTMVLDRLGMANLLLMTFCQPAFPALFQCQVVQSPVDMMRCSGCGQTAVAEGQTLPNTTLATPWLVRRVRHTRANASAKAGRLLAP